MSALMQWFERRNLIMKALFAALLMLASLVFANWALPGSNVVSAQSTPYGSCPHASSAPNHYGQIHVRALYENLETGQTGRANGSTVNVRIVNSSGSSTGQGGNQSTGSNNTTSYCYLRCFYVDNGQFNHNYRVTGSGTPSGLPSGGSWTVQSGTFRNDRVYNITVVYRFTPPPVPYSVRSNLIRGGHNGGGGPDFSSSDSFSHIHRINQNNSGSTSSWSDPDLRRYQITGSTTTSAPARIFRNGVPWDRQGSSLCYNNTSCRTAGAGNTTHPRSITESHADGRQARYFWFYAERDLSPTFNMSASCTNIQVRNMRDLNDTSRNLRIRIWVDGNLEYDVTRAQNTTHNFAYPEHAQTGTNNVVVRVYNYEPPQSWNSASNTTHSTTVNHCFRASCSSDTIANPSDGHILADTEFSTRAVFQNTGQLSWNASGRVTTAGRHDGRTLRPTVPSTGSGNSATITYANFTAPISLDEQTVTMRLYVDGERLAQCTVQFDPYTEYTLTTNIDSARLRPSRENPDTFRLRTTVEPEWNNPAGLSGPGINGPQARRTMTASGSATVSPSTFTDSGTYPENFVDNGTVSNFRAGDEFCGGIQVGPRIGWINRHGGIVKMRGGSTGSPARCERVWDQPYVSVLGADVIAAGNFGHEDCSDRGDIRANFDFNERRGSGTQFAAMALNQIDRFASTKMRNPANETAFSNETTAGDYGGNYPGSHCIADYASYRPSGLANLNSINPGQINTRETGSYNISSANLNSVNTTIPEGRSYTLYRSGNIRISGNVEYANSNPGQGWSSVEDIPSLYVIVEGDIYISSEVTRLDGVYIAQGGSIYTCARPGSSNAVAAHRVFNDCDKPLEVNGSLIADNVVLNRYGGSSLRYGNQTEHQLGGDRTCAQDSDPAARIRPVCAAEVIMFSPELYLSSPILPVTNAPGQGAYDSITSLTPVF